ncbi:hypothetical protein [Luteibacter sp. E-22]|uniref:hypothetical protein n=1 Tax=Luteibacter sp. E-22 TaxID=3404050 RepID=UPI003CF13352
MIIPSWLGRFDTPPAKVDVLGKVGQHRCDPVRLSWSLSTSVKQSLKQMDLTRVRPSELLVIASALRKEGLMSGTALDKIKDFTLDAHGKPGPDLPFNFLGEVRQGLTVAKAMSRKKGDFAPERLYAEFAMSARGLNYLAAAIKGIRPIDIYG